MSEYHDCAAERARIAELEARIAELEELIACLEGQVSCLEGQAACLEGIIAQALQVSWALADWLESILKKTRWVLSHKSGIPRGVWSFARGADTVGRQALNAIHMIISILSQQCSGCGGCD